MRIAGVEHFDTVARLALVEMQHRSAGPIFASPVMRPSVPPWPDPECGCQAAARFRGVPWAALASPALAGPRSTYATPTAMTAPVTGPVR